MNQALSIDSWPQEHSKLSAQRSLSPSQCSACSSTSLRSLNFDQTEHQLLDLSFCSDEQRINAESRECCLEEGKTDCYEKNLSRRYETLARMLQQPPLQMNLISEHMKDSVAGSSPPADPYPSLPVQRLAPAADSDSFQRLARPDFSDHLAHSSEVFGLENRSSPILHSDDQVISLQGGVCFPPLDEKVSMRFLVPEDIPEIKRLCGELFPIEYPDTWYEEITTNPHFFSLAATSQWRSTGGAALSPNHSKCGYSQRKEQIVGLIVAEIKQLSNCNHEDKGILSKTFPSTTAVTYILSLGVTKAWRRRGLASQLLDNLLAYLTNGVGTSLGEVKAVYLHVLVTNFEAIRFYEKRHFRRHASLADYYYIDNTLRDGFSYVLYINGGRAPFSVLECISYGGGVICQPLRWIRRVLSLIFGS